MNVTTAQTSAVIPAPADEPLRAAGGPHGRRSAGPALAHPSGVTATARIRATHNGRTTTVPLLHSDGPFHLRRLRARGEQARVCVLGAMSAPLGGDRLALDITAETCVRLEVTGAAATIALRGPTTAPATYDVRIRVDDDASLHWLPEPLISTRGSTLHQTFAVDLAPTSRLLMREEQLLGRSGEPPGHLTTRLTVRRGGRPLLDQHTAYGYPAPAWDGPAILGPHRAAGQFLLVDPGLGTPQEPHVIGDDPAEGHAVLTPLADPRALIATAVAPTPAQLRHLLDTALTYVYETPRPAAGGEQ
ncbi:Urease accessory protein UreD [Streptomyces sp. AVP053U2]|uniref:urease accessory protein UreD n=1 Tax=unclassified Streptomyces TaxID=2593676 RepID=UPI00073CC912|nr:MULTISPECIES: urease accessory protein UreD [unclassified Streptomyces]ODA70839.1 Urease accessory protein UreD [Streptomyces sp. AVP053U2]